MSNLCKLDVYYLKKICSITAEQSFFKSNSIFKNISKLILSPFHEQSKILEADEHLLVKCTQKTGSQFCGSTCSLLTHKIEPRTSRTSRTTWIMSFGWYGVPLLVKVRIIKKKKTKPLPLTTIKFGKCTNNNIFWLFSKICIMPQNGHVWFIKFNHYLWLFVWVI